MAEWAEAYPGWYALRVRVGREKRVQRTLQTYAIAEYLPTQKHRTKWSDRTVVSERPLFAGYLFAKPDSSLAAYRVSLARDVFQLLGPIDEAEIEAIRQLSAAKVAVIRCSLRKGDAVTVQKGPFRGLEGRVQRLKGGLRLVVSLERFGRSLGVEIDEGDLLAA